MLINKELIPLSKSSSPPFYAFIIAVFLVFNGAASFAQNISITSVSSNLGNVTIQYTINDPNPDRRFTLRLYASTDNYFLPLEHVTGNIGVDQRVGGNKDIVWNTAEEMGSTFNDYIGFEIKGNIYVPFIEVEDFSKYGAFKRGKEYTINWSGGQGDNVLNWQLYKDKKKITTFPDIANVRSFPLILPKNTKPGKDYSFRIADKLNKDQVVNTPTFIKKLQIPVLLKVLAGGSWCSWYWIWHS